MLSLGILQRASEKKGSQELLSNNTGPALCWYTVAFQVLDPEKPWGVPILLSFVQVHPPGKNLQRVPVAWQELRAMAPFAQC